jgi:hypothetical protein
VGGYYEDGVIVYTETGSASDFKEIRLNGVAITATAEEINAMAGTGLSDTELGYLDGALPGSIIASKAVIADASAAISTASLVLESLNPLTIKLNDTDALQFDNAAISSFAAADDTAGNSVYIETEDAGGTTTAARNGGLFNLKTGQGSATTDINGGVGGVMTLATGAGGPGVGTGAGGAGGALSITSGDGGSTPSTASGNGGTGGAGTLQAGTGGACSGGGTTRGGTGGAVSLISGVGGITGGTTTGAAGDGGAVAITAGAGGAAETVTNDGGVGGTVTLTAGAGGATTGGNAGAPGKVVIGAGMFAHVSPQAIDLGASTVALTLVPGTPVGTLVTSNILYLDAGGGAATVKLPPEADADGMVIYIVNTSDNAEAITVQNDAAGNPANGALSIAQNKSATLACDGTSWYTVGLLA